MCYLFLCNVLASSRQVRTEFGCLVNEKSGFKLHQDVALAVNILEEWHMVLYCQLIELEAWDSFFLCFSPLSQQPLPHGKGWKGMVCMVPSNSSCSVIQGLCKTVPLGIST